ncbi:MAG TPA: ComF family protein [Pseudonocardiaceae bacterium]|jgi:predicted amidophosphoribosyltransferase|nr:ComF family protein [Pseudonocardiaceae bacterium]
MITTPLLTRPFTTLADLLLPLRCAGCDLRGVALCPFCWHAIDPGDAPPRPYGRRSPVPIYSVAEYQGRARAVLLAYKERDRRDLAAPLGDLLANALLHLPRATVAQDGGWWLVPAPSRASAARRRGGSHLLRLARATADALARAGHPVGVAPALRFGAGVRDSVGLDRAARAANLAGRVRFRESAAPPVGTRVVLLDDIVTTGATAAACVRELRRAGRPPSVVLTFASA